VYKSELAPMLEKEGYDIINHSIFNIEHHPPSVPPFNLWDFYLLYRRHHFFRKVHSDIGWHVPFLNTPGSDDAEEYIRQRNEHLHRINDTLLQTIQQPHDKPRFVYAHFILPHGPYSFDSTGKNIPEAWLIQEMPEKRVKYIGQVKYANTLMKNYVNAILAGNKRPCVIIIQGDHGFRFSEVDRKQQEFPNFNAMYFSNGDYRLLNDSLTNVNTFRILCNTFFRQNFSMLPDSSYSLQYR
jgi:hypothetical protein